ncbi:MAG: zinc ribbon domain-containing protein, partial [Pseudonocardiaceae bacterium]
AMDSASNVRALRLSWMSWPLLRGLMRCGIRGRRMHGAMIRKSHTYYRCLAGIPGSRIDCVGRSPRTANLGEDVLLEPLNGWIGHLFGGENVGRTVAALIASQEETTAASNGWGEMKSRLATSKRGYVPPRGPSWRAHPRQRAD